MLCGRWVGLRVLVLFPWAHLSSGSVLVFFHLCLISVLFSAPLILKWNEVLDKLFSLVIHNSNKQKSLIVLCLWVVTSSCLIQISFIFLLIQGHASLCKFMQYYASLLLLLLFYSLSKVFSTSPRCSSVSLHSHGPGYSFFSRCRPGPSLCLEVACTSKIDSGQAECCDLAPLSSYLI